VTHVSERRIAPGREHAGGHLGVAVHGHRDRYARLDLQFPHHVDDVGLLARTFRGAQNRHKARISSTLHNVHYRHLSRGVGGGAGAVTS